MFPLRDVLPKTIGVLGGLGPRSVMTDARFKLKPKSTFNTLYLINSSLTAYSNMFVNKVDKLMLSGHNCRVPEVRVLLHIAINIVIDCI